MTDQLHLPDRGRFLTRLSNASAQALTEFRRFAGRPNFFLALAGGIVLTALGGPFGTFHDLTLPLRLLYWGLALAPPALLLTYLSFLARALVAPRSVPTTSLALAVGLVGAVPSWALVVALEFALPFPDPMSAADLFPLVLVPVLVMAVLINLLFDATGGTRRPVADTGKGTVDPRANPPRTAPIVPGGDSLRLLGKLPPKIGSDVISLQAQGHYVAVTTRQGRALILMSLSDAEGDLADQPGLRVHRSWWVNLRHARRLSVQGGRVRLELSNGVTVPVARTLRRQLEADLNQFAQGIPAPEPTRGLAP